MVTIKYFQKKEMFRPTLGLNRSRARNFIDVAFGSRDAWLVNPCGPSTHREFERDLEYAC
jgi:hypothetical protein